MQYNFTLFNKNCNRGDVVETLCSTCSLRNDIEKYSGIRWIGQPSYAIKSTSQNDFLAFETNLTKGMIIYNPPIYPMTSGSNTPLFQVYVASSYAPG